MSFLQDDSIVRLGVIGCGRIAVRFVPEVKYVSGSNLEGVYHPRVDSARKYAEQFYEYIRKALEQGKYVSCEKSLVLQLNSAVNVRFP